MLCLRSKFHEWSKIITETQINDIICGYKQCQLVKNHRRFSDNLGLHHRRFWCVAIMLRTEMIPETPPIFNQLIELIAREYCIKIKFNLRNAKIIKEYTQTWLVWLSGNSPDPNTMGTASTAGCDKLPWFELRGFHQAVHANCRTLPPK
jgi:hypothetical protein